MIDALSAMLAILGTWVLIVLVASGLGLLVRRACGCRDLRTDDIFMGFWTGLAMATMFLQIWNLFLPVNGLATLGLSFLGAAGFLLYSREAAAWISRILTTRRQTLAVVIVMVVWMANRALGPCEHNDSGLYQVQAVRWASEYPIVPGLANLSPNLGFNTSSSLLSAALDVGYWYGRSAHLWNSVLLAAALAQSIMSIGRLVRGDNTEPMASSLLGMCFLTPAIDLAMSEHVRSATTDVPAAFILMAAACRLFQLLLTAGESGDRARSDMISVCVIAACSVTFKVSSGAFGLGLWFVAVWFWLRSSPQWGISGARRWTPVAASVALSSLIAGVWLVRGVILSGYVIFPSTAIPIDVDWRVPKELADANLAWIKQFARLPDVRPTHEAKGLAWILPWIPSLLKAGPVKFAIPVAIAGGATALAVLWRNRPAVMETPARGLLLLIPIVASILFWMATAPAPRFGFFMFWVWAGVSAGLVAQRWLGTAGHRTRVLLSLAMVGWIVPAAMVRTVVIYRAKGAEEAWRIFINPPGTDTGMHPMFTQQFEVKRTASGDRVHVPINSDLSWDGPLPMAPYFDPNLAWRVPGDLSKGFRSATGNWEPDLWPHYGSNYMSMWKQSQGMEPPGELVALPRGTTRKFAPFTSSPLGGRESRTWTDESFRRDVDVGPVQAIPTR